MEVLTKIYFLDDDRQKFFGEGPYLLLKEIEKRGSLRSAAISMDMAYTKALRILKTAEKAIGCPLTSRKTGGKDGGGSRLTKEGKEWVQRYGAYRKACMAANRQIYNEFFPKQR